MSAGDIALLVIVVALGLYLGWALMNAERI